MTIPVYPHKHKYLGYHKPMRTFRDTSKLPTIQRSPRQSIFCFMWACSSNTRASIILPTLVSGTEEVSHHDPLDQCDWCDTTYTRGDIPTFPYIRTVVGFLPPLMESSAGLCPSWRQRRQRRVLFNQRWVEVSLAYVSVTPRTWFCITLCTCCVIFRTCYAPLFTCYVTLRNVYCCPSYVWCYRSSVWSPFLWIMSPFAMWNVAPHMYDATLLLCDIYHSLCEVILWLV